MINVIPIYAISNVRVLWLLLKQKITYIHMTKISSVLSDTKYVRVLTRFGAGFVNESPILETTVVVPKKRLSAKMQKLKVAGMANLSDNL